jgi:quercetin dioxygenase-like cupin family protein
MPQGLRRHYRAIGLTFVVTAILAVCVPAFADTTTTTAPVTRTVLAQAAPANAPGQTLTLQRVRIEPGAKLAEHYHQGTQVARVVKGTLTYDVVSGTATVTHRDGTSEQVPGPKRIRLRTGESLVENAGLVHYGSNTTRRTVLIELAALLEEGAPASTPVGSGATGTPLRITVNLESQARTLTNAGADASIVYGWNRLTGTTTLDGQPVSVELLGSVRYTKGSGPFSGFVTFTFSDASTLGVQMQGTTTASADGANASFAATLGVIGGTGRYVVATGTGTFTGNRTAALGGAVAATFAMNLGGVR